MASSSKKFFSVCLPNPHSFFQFIMSTRILRLCHGVACNQGLPGMGLPVMWSWLPSMASFSFYNRVGMRAFPSHSFLFWVWRDIFWPTLSSQDLIVCSGHRTFVCSTSEINWKSNVYHYSEILKYFGQIWSFFSLFCSSIEDCFNLLSLHVFSCQTVKNF